MYIIKEIQFDGVASSLPRSAIAYVCDTYADLLLAFDDSKAKNAPRYIHLSQGLSEHMLKVSAGFNSLVADNLLMKKNPAWEGIARYIGEAVVMSHLPLPRDLEAALSMQPLLKVGQLFNVKANIKDNVARIDIDAPLLLLLELGYKRYMMEDRTLTVSLQELSDNPFFLFIQGEYGFEIFVESARDLLERIKSQIEVLRAEDNGFNPAPF